MMEAKRSDLRHLQQMGVEKYQSLEYWLDEGYAVEFCKHGGEVGCRIYHGSVRSEHPEAGAVLSTPLGAFASASHCMEHIRKDEALLGGEPWPRDADEHGTVTQAELEGANAGA